MKGNSTGGEAQKGIDSEEGNSIIEKKTKRTIVESQGPGKRAECRTGSGKNASGDTKKGIDSGDSNFNRGKKTSESQQHRVPIQWRETGTQDGDENKLGEIQVGDTKGKASYGGGSTFAGVFVVAL